MLAEQVVDWTQEGLREGFEKDYREAFEEGYREGIKKSAETLQKLLLTKLEQRFGSLPAQIRLRVESIGSTKELSSIKELAELIARSQTVPSLDALF